MSFNERDTREDPEKKRTKVNFEHLDKVRKAKLALDETHFSPLINKFKEENPERFSVSYINWDGKGQSQAVEVSAPPYSVGIVVVWDKHQEIKTIEGNSQMQTTFRRILIVANPQGWVSLEGATWFSSRQSSNWGENPQEIEKAFKIALENPKLVTTNRQLQRNRHGILQI